MPVSITIQVKDVRWKQSLRPYTKTIKMVAEAVLAAKKNKTGELCFVLADDTFVRELNKTYRKKNKPTNVLSFVGEGEYIGDVVLAFETVALEARQQQKHFRNHAAHLLVHGVLHLLGHDHLEEKEAKKMEQIEIKILKKLNISNPYL